jgi:DNA-binding transcriptional regulator YiaG
MSPYKSNWRRRRKRKRLFPDFYYDKKLRLSPEDLKWIRTRFRMSQSEFADEVGVNRATVCQWEGGKKRISPMASRLIKLIVRHYVTMRSIDGETEGNLSEGQ